jgi:nucleotide-binding universal stress UspA family protein
MPEAMVKDVPARTLNTVEKPMAKRKRALFKRAKWDKQPAQSSAVLIATVGIPIPKAVIRRAIQLSEGRPVAVVSIARIYGSSLGLPTPGLLPTRKEMDEQRALVADAIGRLERSGVEAWGQVASTRRYAKTIAHAARARGVDVVLVVSPDAPRWRRIIEGDTARDVRRRIGQYMTVDGITV